MQYKNDAPLELPPGVARNGHPENCKSTGAAASATLHWPVLVSENQELAAAVSNQLRKNIGMGCRVMSFAGVREALARCRDDMVLMLATNAQDIQHADYLVREVALQKMACITIVLTMEHCPEQGLAELGEHVAHLLVWPRDFAILAELLKHRPLRRPFAEAGIYPDDSMEERVAQRLLAQTPSLLPLVEKLALAAEHDVTVLLTGETGTGKTFLARLIHDLSPRGKDRFLTVPCGALSPNLVESEFFGHVKGAFTGADRNKIGKFAAAGDGTLLLDEIDALGMDQQANLLRVVETGEYEPVGSNETTRSTCRLIVASNRNLKEEADRGKFRQDLYYRFNVMSFHLPPLRERIEDIAPLVRAFAARYNTRFRKDLYDISGEAMAALESYPWPGNLRELENAVQQAVLISQGPVLLVRHLPEIVREQALSSIRTSPLAVDTLVHNREVLERSVIQRALANHGYSRARAASELGISRVTLYKKMKKYGLMKSAHSTPSIAQ